MNKIDTFPVNQQRFYIDSVTNMITSSNLVTGPIKCQLIHIIPGADLDI